MASHRANGSDDVPGLSLLLRSLVETRDFARAANAAGMYTIGYRNESESEQDLSVADEVVDNPAELRERLLALV